MNNSDVLKWTGEIAGKGPSARSRHTCTPVKHFLVIFGGLNHRVRYNDLWIYDTKNKAWTELRVEASEAEEWVQFFESARNESASFYERMQRKMKKSDVLPTLNYT